MLRTGKQVWEAQAKRSALGIRQEELEFHIQRYTVLITQSAILTGFSFESIVHLEVPEGTDWRVSAWFFGSISLANMCSVYVVVVGSCLVVLGNQLALLGQDGDSLERAVTHLRKRRFTLFFMGFVALFAMISGGMALAWIKMGVGKRTPPPRTHARTSTDSPQRRSPCARALCAIAAASIVTAGFGFFAAWTLWSVLEIFCALGGQQLVTGSTKFFTPNGYFDLATLQPGVGNPEVLANDKYSADVV